MVQLHLRSVLKSWASANASVSKVHVFGSRSGFGKSPRKDSDLDIAIEFEPKLNNLAYWIASKEKLEQSLQPKIPYRLQLEWYGGSNETPIIHQGLCNGHVTVYELAP
jgi:predicted nucleotidyltransferase